jgi:hypothetical protein
LSGAATSAFSTMSGAAAPLTFLDSSNKEAADLRGWPKRIPFLSYPVVRRERFGARGIHIRYRFSIEWGASWSYLEFPNHQIVRVAAYGGKTQWLLMTFLYSNHGLNVAFFVFICWNPIQSIQWSNSSTSQISNFSQCTLW